jgi:hypothetical protein
MGRSSAPPWHTARVQHRTPSDLAPLCHILGQIDGATLVVVSNDGPVSVARGGERLGRSTTWAEDL